MKKRYLGIEDGLVEFEINLMEEHEPPDGMFSFQEDIDHVKEGIRNGNEWAWTCVKVTARIPGIDLEGTDYLGGCSYKDQADFEADGYYADMKKSALDDLKSQLKTLIEKLKEYKLIGENSTSNP